MLCLYTPTQTYAHTYLHMQTHKTWSVKLEQEKKRSICRACHIGNGWVILLEGFTSYLKNSAFTLNEMGN